MLFHNYYNKLFPFTSNIERHQEMAFEEIVLSVEPSVSIRRLYLALILCVVIISHVV